MLPGASSINITKVVENKFIDFSFDLKSVNLFLSSVLRSATDEACFIVSVATHSDKLERCAKPPFRRWSSHKWSLILKHVMWSNRLCNKLSLPCLLWGPHTDHGLMAPAINELQVRYHQVSSNSSIKRARRPGFDSFQTKNYGGGNLKPRDGTFRFTASFILVLRTIQLLYSGKWELFPGE